MAQIRHGSVRTTQAVRRAIQRSQESLQTLANRHGLDPKTVAKWRKRSTLQDARMGPEPASMLLRGAEEAIAVAFRRRKRNSKTIPSATCTSILRKCRPSRVSSIPSRPSTAPVKWRLPNATRGPNALPRPSFCGAYSTSWPIKGHTVLTDNGVQFTPQPH